jgi:hypothetical protein
MMPTGKGTGKGTGAWMTKGMKETGVGTRKGKGTRTRTRMTKEVGMRRTKDMGTGTDRDDKDGNTTAIASNTFRMANSLVGAGMGAISRKTLTKFTVLNVNSACGPLGESSGHVIPAGEQKEKGDQACRQEYHTIDEECFITPSVESTMSPAMRKVSAVVRCSGVTDGKCRDSDV